MIQVSVLQFLSRMVSIFYPLLFFIRVCSHLTDGFDSRQLQNESWLQLQRRCLMSSNDNYFILHWMKSILNDIILNVLNYQYPLYFIYCTHYFAIYSSNHCHLTLLLVYYKQYNNSQTTKDITMQADPLFLMRKRFALHSLQKSHIRIKKQRQLIQNYDQIQLDQKFDELVYGNSSFESICTEYGDTSSVTCGRFSADSKYYVTAGASGLGKVWNTVDEFSHDFGKEICELKGDEKLCVVDMHPNIGNIPAFAPNILTGSTNGQIGVWTFDPNLKNQKSIKVKGHADRINCIRFHQSSAAFITGSYDKSWGIWDANRIKQLSNQKGHSKEIHSLALHPDGSLILTGDLGGQGMIWDLRTGKGIFQFFTTNSIVCSSFHPNGFQFAIGGKNNLINIFDLRRKKQLKAIPAHLKLVSDVAYSQNGSFLISAGHDNVVKLWHGRNYSSVGSQLQHPSKISSISISNGKLGVTMLDRKWTVWSNRKRTMDEVMYKRQDKIKIEEGQENQQRIINQ